MLFSRTVNAGLHGCEKERYLCMGKIVSCEFFCCAFRKLCFFEMLLCLCSNADWDGGDESVLEWGIFLSEWVAFFNGFVMGKGSGVLCCGEFVCV